MSDIRIRKVKVLQGKPKEEAEEKGLNPDDLVIVIGDHIEKIDGDPVSYLLKRSQKIDVEEREDECYYGAEHCANTECRDRESCLGCFVIAPPKKAEN